MKTNFRARLLCSTLLIGAAVLPTAAYAQDTTAEPATEEATEVVVTGTLISNPNLISSSPVSVIGENEIQLRNEGNAEELIRDLPGAVPGIGSATNNGNGGFSTVDLRGLGAQRNLVLLDGNRLVVANQSGTVDLNNIPVALIQRTEVLTGGASTTYGADAVSGVVNFITRKDFAGMELAVGNSITERGDGHSFRADLTLGVNFDDGRGNAVLSLGYQEADAIYQGARDISVFEVNGVTGRAAGSSATSVPTTISIRPNPAGNATRSQLNTGGTLLVPEYAGFNFNPYNIFQTPYKRHNIYAAANYEVSDTIEVYARGMFSRNVVSTIIAPSGIFGEALTIRGDNPYLPSGVRDQLCNSAGIALGGDCNTHTAIPMLEVYRRTTELGPRVSEYTTTMFDYRAGAKVKFSESIALDLSAGYGESDLVQIQSGYVLRSRVQQALNATNTTSCINPAGGCVPLNLFGPQGSITPEQAAFLAGSSTITIKNKLSQARALLTGDFGASLWADEAIGFAVGAEYRKYEYARLPDNFAAVPGELGGAGGAVPPFAGGYDVKEVYGELIAPIAADKPFFHSLTAEAGVRYSSYSVDAPGDPSFETTTWKAGLSWEPVDSIKFRGNYQRAVRAPNVDELFRPVTTNLTNLTVDPCQLTLPNGNANLTLACLNQGATAVGAIPVPTSGQINFTGGGNANIKPETADTFTVGAIFRPSFVPGLTVSVDYYNIKINDAITRQTPDDALAACFGTARPVVMTAAQANSTACTIIRRNPSTGSLSGSPASTPGLFLPLTNNGRLATDGIDLAVSYQRKFGDVGLNLNFTGNWTNHLRFRASPTALNRECVGYYSVNCGPSNAASGGQIQPKFSFQQRTTLSFGPADVSLLWRYIHPVRYEPGLTPIFSGTITAGPGGAGSPMVGRVENFNHIEAFHYFDLTTRFEVNEHLDLVFGVSNLFDREPPITGHNVGQTGSNSGNTFPSTYDTIGRRFNASAKIRF
ncbi:TonB-dependent receptor domain-containing protein [Sphingomonas koreensis]